MLAFFCRYDRLEKPAWRKPYLKHMERVRSCHSKVDGGVRKSFYSVETKSGEIYDVVFNEEELLWTMESKNGEVVDRVLALIQRHKHQPSRAHRVIPYWFEILPKELALKDYSGTDHPLIHRVQPFRFKTGKIPSSQVQKIVTTHVENLMTTKHYHYVVKTDLERYFHLVYEIDELDWRLMQEVDEELLFLK